MSGYSADPRIRWTEWLPWVAAIAFFFLMPGYLSLGARILIFILFALSLDLILGYTGMVSFGHAAYFGLGAYASALVLIHFAQPIPVALLAGALLAGLIAVPVGWFSTRATGIYFAMLTLAFAQITWSVVYQWDTFTGGYNGLIGVWPAPWLSAPAAYYYLTLATSVAAIAFMWRTLYAPFGYVLRAARDSPLRAESVGSDDPNTLFNVASALLTDDEDIGSFPVGANCPLWDMRHLAATAEPDLYARACDHAWSYACERVALAR